METELRLFSLKKYKDDRGFFQETFNKILQQDISADFVQDNESLSKKGVIRGMHYQWDKPMGKLVRCSFGEIIDVVVDIRKNSKDYGKVRYYNLSLENSNALWVPPGFAHGFEVISDIAIVTYKCTAFYNKNGESGINPFDKNLNIKWRSINKVVSEKDLIAKSFIEYNKDIKF